MIYKCKNGKNHGAGIFGVYYKIDSGQVAFFFAREGQVNGAFVGNFGL